MPSPPGCVPGLPETGVQLQAPPACTPFKVARVKRIARPSRPARTKAGQRKRMNSVAMPRNEKKPATSVTVVSSIDEDVAGS